MLRNRNGKRPTRSGRWGLRPQCRGSPRSDSEAELLGRLWRASVLPQPPGRGGRDRRLTGRPTRDGSADRSAQGMRSCASQLRCLARSVGGGARGAGAVDRQAILAQGRELDDEVERRADLLS